MDSINFVVLGNPAVAMELGKKGAESDITFYERKASGRIITLVVPSGFPEKIQPLLQAIHLAEYAIVNVAGIDRQLGEQIVALDAAGLRRGFILAEGYEDQVRKLVEGTALDAYQFVSLDQLRREIDVLPAIKIDGPRKVVIDAAFEVKGVGTVALGVVRRGEVRKHDELVMFPQNRTVTVRSIQMHDDDVDSAPCSGRVGLALKGTEASEIPRGEVIADSGSMLFDSNVYLSFEKSRFYRADVSPSSSYHLCIGLQIKPVKVKMDADLLATAEKPFAFERGERCVLLDLNSTGVRVVGSGTVL